MSKTMRFGDFVTLQRGFDLPKQNMVDGPYPVVGSTSVVGWHATYKQKPPGVVTGRSGSLGVVQYVDQPYWPHNTSLWVKDFKGNSPRYVYYFLQTLNLKNYNAGAGVPTLNRNHLETLQIPKTSLPVQRKIAAILSAYDDLIENNTRRIRVLEAMAAALYREWFIEFRFPGHEAVPLVESKLGKAPQGWEVTCIGDVVEILGGGTPSTKNPEYWDNGTVNWFSPTDLTATRGMFIGESKTKITNLGLQKSSARLFSAYSVMMTSRATIGVVSINTQQSCTNQGFITCLPNERMSAFQIFFWMLEMKDEIIAHASGATFKEINKATFRKLPIVIADGKISAEFVRIMQPIGGQIENLQRRNANLRQTRDMLLPKLMSGEVDVSQLAIAGVEEVL